MDWPPHTNVWAPPFSAHRKVGYTVWSWLKAGPSHGIWSDGSGAALPSGIQATIAALVHHFFLPCFLSFSVPSVNLKKEERRSGRRGQVARCCHYLIHHHLILMDRAALRSTLWVAAHEWFNVWELQLYFQGVPTLLILDRLFQKWLINFNLRTLLRGKASGLSTSTNVMTIGCENTTVSR